MQYEVFLAEKSVGLVDVTKEGLYYRFECNCKIKEEGMYRLLLHSQTQITDLGLCILDQGRWMLSKKYPIKKIGQSPFRFTLSVTPEVKKKDYMFAVSQMSPFPYLHMLTDTSCFRNEGNVAMIIL